MVKKTKKQFTVRLPEESSRTVELLTQKTGLSVSELIDRLLTRTEQESSAPKPTVLNQASLIDPEALFAELSSMKAEISSLGRYFERLVLRLNDVIRTPSFLEYRAMEAAYQVDYGNLEPYTRLIAQAKSYHALYGVWPTPNSPMFGNYTIEKEWPSTPPVSPNNSYRGDEK